jgi:hypothetical protein
MLLPAPMMLMTSCTTAKLAAPTEQHIKLLIAVADADAREQRSIINALFKDSTEVAEHAIKN